MTLLASWVFDTSGFPARWDCGVWPPWLGWLHIASDLLIWLAYLAIPVILILFIRRRRDTPFPGLFWLFGAFIITCGTTHLLEAVIFYEPIYRLAGFVKVFTAVTSWATVIALLPVIPKALAMRSSQGLEREVAVRTAELVHTNAELQREAAERVRAEESLADERERFRLTLASIGDGVIATDVEGRVTFINDVACSLTGWPEDDARGRLLPEVFPVFDEASRERMESPALRAIREGKAVASINSTMLSSRGGTERPIENCASPIRAGGDLVGAVLVFRDATERRQAHEAHARLAAIVDSSEDAVIGAALDGTITNWNRAAESLLGYAEAEAVGKPIDPLVPPELADEMPGILARIRRGERVGHFDSVRLRKDGARVIVSLSVSPVKDSNGRVIGAAKIVRDITRRKQDEEALHRQTEQLRLQGRLLNLSQAVVREVGGRITTWTDGMARLYGWTKEQAEGKVSHELFHTRFPRPLEEIDARLLRDGEWEGELVHRRPDGAEITVLSRWVLDRRGDLLRVLEAHRDITERKRHERELDDQRRQFRTFAESIQQLCWMAGPDGHIFWYNQRWYDYTGTTFEKMQGWGWQSVHDPYELPKVLERWKASIASGEPFDMVFPIKGSDGVFRPFLTRVMPVEDDEGRVTQWFGTNTDISEQKRTEELLRQSEEVFRSAFEDTNVAMVLTDSGHRFVRVNAAFAHLFGYTPEEMLSLAMEDVTHPDDVAESHSRREPLASGAADYFQMEKRYLHKDGHVFWGMANISIIRDVLGKPLKYVGQVQDITERRLAEKRLSSQHAVVRILAEADGLAEAGQLILRAVCESIGWDVGELWMVDPQANTLTCSAIWCDGRAELSGFAGVSRQTVFAPGVGSIGRAWGENRAIWMTDVTMAKDFLRAAAAQRAGLRGGFAFPIVVGNDTLGVAGFFSRESREPDSELLRLFSSLGSQIGQFVERKRAEESLRMRDRAIQATPQGITITDPTQPDNPITYASPGFQRLTGYEYPEVVGRNCRFLQGGDTDPEAVALLRTAIRQERPCKVELRNYRKDGTGFWNELTISPVRDEQGRLTHFVGVQIDITERRNLEEQYRQSQKMEVVGQLAGGVAHDFNNLLCVINGYGELVLEKLPAEDPSREMIEQITRAGERAAGLTRQLLAFSRKAIVAPEVMDLNAIVAEMEKMLRRTIGENIVLAATLQPELGRIKADPGQVEQVLMNLCVNARDAMPRGGKLTIETRDVELDETYADARVDVRPGRYVMLAVGDTGHGMTDEVKKRIFEPFFTTKEKGRGTGLGLATVFGVVKQNGGSVEVYSEPGRGTTFNVYLPRVAGVAALRKSNPGLSAAPRGAETVLLVEDEDSVRALARIVLTSNGYTVLEAGHGEEALRIAARHTGPIQLLVSDVVMPELGGPELAGRLLALHPETKVLFLSGYTDDAIIRHGIVQEKVNFLEKPYSTVVLARKVREVLDSAQ